MSGYILGISAFYHDSAAALLRDGQIVAAAQEERFTRKKHDPSFPLHAVQYCLREAGISAEQLDYVGFYDKPLLTFERLLETHLATAPAGIRLFLKSMNVWLKQKLWIPQTIQRELRYEGPVLFAEHHESHAASAFYPSPFTDAAILTLDGVGEWTTTSYGYGRQNQVSMLAEIPFPHSLGLLYSAFTYHCGFKVNSGEYKLMGLAPYGEPRYVDRIMDHLIDLKEDGSFRLSTRYFNYLSGLTMTNRRFSALFDGPPHPPEADPTQREMDLARSCQVVTEEIVLRMARHLHAETGLTNLCIAGGVGLNCVANGRLLREGPFERIWIQPAAGDAGGALGAAYLLWHRYLGHDRSPDGLTDAMGGALLGPGFTDGEIHESLQQCAAVATRVGYPDLPERVASLLAAGKVVGWFQGRMEFGPRALGARSILGDPRSAETQRVMNLKIKYRESFRPFAPAVLREHVSDFFAMEEESPYMLLVAPVQQNRRIPVNDEQERLFGIEKLRVPRSDIPAVTHVDYSARVQTVDRAVNPLYYDMIEAFGRLTGHPLVVNTSFNVRGEPIVCTPEDAYRCFMRTEMDYLAVGPFLLDKNDQPEWHEGHDWREEFALD